jgi:Methyltransferase domain
MHTYWQGTVLLAGARKLRQSGRGHTVDPFDGAGDGFSVPVYLGIRDALEMPLRQRFKQNIRDADLGDWVAVHQGHATEISAGWTTPVDLLFLDGDESPAGASVAYGAWAPFLKVGGTIAIHNSRPGVYAKSHDGLMRLANATIRLPDYAHVRLVGSTTLARKAIDRSA